MMKNNIFKIDGIFLAVVGTLAGITDLASYFFGKGPFGQTYFQNSIAIGGFEAHGLAVIAGFVLFLNSKSPDAAFFSKVAIAIHSVLGISNLIWFQVFLDTSTIPMGIITTVIHFTLVFFHCIALYDKRRSAVTQSFKN